MPARLSANNRGGMRLINGGQVAQLVEQWTENPRVAGSTPALSTEDVGSGLIVHCPIFGVFGETGSLLSRGDAPAFLTHCCFDLSSKNDSVSPRSFSATRWSQGTS